MTAAPPFQLYEMVTSDGQSYTGAVVDGAGELLVLAGGAARPHARRTSVRLHAGRWHHVTVVQERKRPLSSSALAVYLDGVPAHASTVCYPSFECAHHLELLALIVRHKVPDLPKLLGRCLTHRRWHEYDDNQVGA